MAQEPVAIFRFFSMSGCKFCRIFKGEVDGKIDPNSGWETLSSDKELLGIPIKFVVYLFGSSTDPQTGKQVNYVLDEVSAARIKANGVGYPYLEMYSPDEKSGFFKVDLNAVIKGWAVDQCVPQLKKWILETIRKPGFQKKSVAAPQLQQAVSAPKPSLPIPNQSQESLIARGRTQEGSVSRLLKTADADSDRVAPSTFGMGAKELKPPIITPEIKRAPRFLPSNYDE